MNTGKAGSKNRFNINVSIDGIGRSKPHIWVVLISIVEVLPEQRMSDHFVLIHSLYMDTDRGPRIDTLLRPLLFQLQDLGKHHLFTRPREQL
jgi:hypothetical protein